MELSTSLQMAKLASLQLATPAAYYNILTTENDSLVNYWPQQSFWISIFTWKCCQLLEFTSKLTINNFPNFSMVNKPLQIILGYTSNWNTNNSSSNLLYLIWSTIRGERAFQKFTRCYLFANRSDRPSGKEISRAQFSLIFPIGDILSILFKLLQQLLCLWFLLAEWSVLQPSVNPVVGSSQPLCRKLSFFWLFSVFCSFSLEFLHNYRAFTVLILITHAYGEDPSVLSSLSPILPSSSEDLWFISPVICLLLRSVVHCLTLIPLFAG